MFVNNYARITVDFSRNKFWIERNLTVTFNDLFSLVVADIGNDGFFQYAVPEIRYDQIYCFVNS